MGGVEFHGTWIGKIMAVQSSLLISETGFS